MSTGDVSMKSWNMLVEATIQKIKIRGAITCHSASEESAKRLARMTFINHLRGAGIWAYTNEVDESYKVEDKKEETKHRKITQYHAPYWDHVEVIEIIENGSRDFTFPVEELEETARLAAGIVAIKPKRRTTGNVVLNGRKKKQSLIVKKEKQLEKKQKVEANKQSKEELLQVVEGYFTGSIAKIIKDAVGELNQTYQRIRYALFQIKEKGYNNTEYDLIQTEIKGSKAFRLTKKKGK